MKPIKNTPTVGDIKKRINAMRNSKMKNSDGSVSTHKMAWDGNDEEGYMVYPTIFPNDDGSWTDYLSDGESDENWNKTYDEAMNRGEIISGLSRTIAEDIAGGSWKNMGKLELKNKDITNIMKLKKYGAGGKYKMYQDGGPVKAKKKKMSPEEREAELTKMAGVAKERLEEMEGEKAYLARRKEAEREYKQAIKEGATPEQATKIAEKYMSKGGKMSMYKKGGMVKAKKSC